MGSVRLLAAGGVGLFSGIVVERFRTRRTSSSDQPAFGSDSFPLKALPALPIFGSVSAATPIPTESSPIPTTALARSDKPEIFTPGPNRVSEIMRFGFPGLDNVRSRKNFVLSYDTRNRTAKWVFEHLTKHVLNKNEEVDRNKCDFHEDQSLHPYFRSTNSDYRGSGYDRGHLAPAGNHKHNQELCSETFVLSNIAPQVGVGFNRDKWEHLERYVRKLTKIYKNVYVCTGPLFLPRRDVDGKSYVRYQVIGQNNVAVPTHFFKIVVGENDNDELELEAYVLPNEPIPDSTPLATFQVPPDAIERASGLLFFDKIAREHLKKINGKPNTK